MAGKPTAPVCAAHGCLQPRFKEGLCADHWHREVDWSAQMAYPWFGAGTPGPEAGTVHRLDTNAAYWPESLVICEAIWNAS